MLEHLTDAEKDVVIRYNRIAADHNALALADYARQSDLDRLARQAAGLAWELGLMRWLRSRRYLICEAPTECGGCGEILPASETDSSGRCNDCQTWL